MTSMDARASRPRRSIGARLFLLVGIGMLLVLVVLGGTSAGIVARLRQQIFVDRGAWARAVADRVDEMLRADLEALQQVSAAPGFNLEDADPAPEHTALRGAWLGFHSSDSVFLLDAECRLVHDEPTHTAHVAEAVRDAARQALGTGRPLVTGVLRRDDGRGHVYTLMPLRNWKLEPVGVVGLASEPQGSRLSAIVEAAKPGTTGAADLLDRDGEVLASTDAALAGELAEHRPMVSDLVARHGALVGTCAGCHGDHPELGDRHEILASAALKSAPWLIRTREPETEAMALARITPTRLLAIAAALLGLGLVFALGVARSVRRPLAMLTGAAEGIAAGNLARPIPSLADDEIGRLARSLEHMRLVLRLSLETIERQKSELEARVEERTRQLNEANAALRAREEARLQLLRKVITAQEDERRRIARELHDETSQVLAALMMRIDRAFAAPSVPVDGGALAEIKTIAVRALDEVHRLVLDLRPSVLDDLGLLAGIRWIADRHLAPAGIAARCEFDVDRRLPPEVETTLFRVAQEAITNIARHADASSVLIQVAEEGDKLVVEIEDDGKGFDVPAVSRPDARRLSFGLLGMRERVELLGGSLTIESAPGEGTRVAAEVPLRGES